MLRRGPLAAIQSIEPQGTVIAAKKSATPIRQLVRRGGRPSPAVSAHLRERILDSATQLFLAEGYGSSTIEAVATHAGVSKRTFYDRFDDKAQLFAAVVHRIIGQIRPAPEVPLFVGVSLHEILLRLAGLILRAALSPQALALHRLVSAESMRFPELAHAVEKDGSEREAMTLISGLLAREHADLQLSAEDLEFAAEQFIFMVVTLPQRRAMRFNITLNQAQMNTWAEKTTTLFLKGFRGFAR
jgi:TetR/AcrR family transcriptional regulator, mexJK operon transcriptional repressor